MTTEELIDSKDETIASGFDDTLMAGFDSIENAIFNAVNKKVATMDQEDGEIKFDPGNLLILNELVFIIANSIQNSRYPSNVKSYTSYFTTVKNYNLDIQNQLNGFSIEELDEIASTIEAQTINQIIVNLTGQGITSSFIDPLVQLIYKNIVSGTNIDQLKNAIETFIKSNEQRLGQFKRYVTQIARDALHQYDGAINARIATQFGMDAFRYVGSLIKDSRPQCVRWVGKGILLKKELSSELAWAAANGTGLIPGTTPDNFAIYRGGYNCRHTAIPIRLTKEQKEQYGVK